MALIHASVPSENWDDDFEFHARLTATTTNTTKNPNTNDVHEPAHRMSIASSDWDHDDNDHDVTSPTTNNSNNATILEDKKNTLHLSQEWIEPGPSTPRRNPTHAHARSTENWDDDFEDSPVRKAFPSPPGRNKSSSSQARRVQQHQQQPRPESWDDEFDGIAPNASPARRPRSKPRSQPRPDSGVYSSEDEEPGTDDIDFGYTARDEEDRTVTARSRRAFSRLPAGDTPPPPVPALPLPFLLPTSNGSISPGPSPFPRSPTSSVFSVPTTLRPPSSAFTVTSTTPLRPSTSRSSSGFAGLPPSPPIHRERERRRLRKKSRPPQGTVMELSVLHRERESDEYDYRYETGGEGEEPEVVGRPKTPPPVPLPAQSTPATPSGSGGAAGALLSRIGSVKKWGVRRKRGSTTPGEVVKLDTDPRNLPGPNNTNANLTPRPVRPHSQASYVSSVPSSSGSSNAHPLPQSHSHSLATTSYNKRMSSPHTGTGAGTWFFRSASASRGSTSEVDLPTQAQGQGQPQTPIKNRNQNGRRVEESPSPGKLLKRKSLGFVQLRMGLRVGVHGDDAVERGREQEREKEREQEKEREREREKYGGLGLGHAGVGDREKEPNGEVHDSRRERESSGEKEQEKEKEKEKEGSRTFMGSVRRISLVGRHKRTKSGVSLAHVAERLDVGMGLRDDTHTPTPKSVAAAHAHDTNTNKAPLAGRGEGQTPTKSQGTNARVLLPPIELQPPSPPRVRPGTQRLPSGGSGMLSPTSSSSTVASSPSTSPRRSPLGSPQAASLGRSTVSSEVATVVGVGAGMGAGTGVGGGVGGAMRRNSLGDLKIPERISQAQVGLRKDMERVREFAAGVEQLKEMQKTYDGLVAEVQGILDAHVQQLQYQSHQQQQRASSPAGFFANLPRPMSRGRSNTNPPPPSASTVSLTVPPSSAPALDKAGTYKQLASAYYTIKSRYRISWECAELLIELGSGSTNGPSTSASAPVVPLSTLGVDTEGGAKKSGRERAITLGGGEDVSKPPTPVPGQTAPSVSAPSMGVGVGVGGKSGWRASTGKHDLSQRQLVLLKEILSGGDAVGAGAEEIPEEAVTVNREWRWGKDAMGSTVTLPSEDSSAPEGVGGDTGAEEGSAVEGKQGRLKKKRRASRLGMTGLRDMLRSLKRSSAEPVPTLPPMSSTSLSTTDNSSIDSHRYPHARVPAQGRRRAKTSSGPEHESMRLGRPTSPYSPSSLSASSKPSPRRPSLASIFRLGQKAKPASPELPPELREYNHYHHQNRPRSRMQESSSTGEEEDWDRMDDASDMDAAAARALGLGTGPGHDTSATVRGKGPKLGRSPYLQDAYTPSLPSLPVRPLTPKRSASGSQSSIWGAGAGEGSGSGSGSRTPPPHPHARTTRLSNVEEHGGESGRAPQVRPSSRGSHYRSGGGLSPLRLPKSGSVRSMPPQSALLVPDPMLAMTPENIRPLLDNAREVHARLGECIEEIRALLAAYLHP